MHDIRFVFGYYHTELFSSSLLILLWFSSYTYNVDDVDPVLAKHYDALRYDLSFKG